MERILLQRRVKATQLFFRADDIGVSAMSFTALCRLFSHFGVPLALATVPAWLNEKRAPSLFNVASPSDPLWCWHQHGWRHVNWEKNGKKSEFGTSRTETQKWRDLWRGYHKMRSIFGTQFLPVFTPPWNRMSRDTLLLLQQIGFEAVSCDETIPKRSRKVKIRNFRICLDLHTRKIQHPQYAYDELMEGCANLFISREPAGIMIHHNRMNLNAFLFLAHFLDLAIRSPSIEITSFRVMLNHGKP